MGAVQKDWIWACLSRHLNRTHATLTKLNDAEGEILRMCRTKALGISTILPACGGRSRPPRISRHTRLQTNLAAIDRDGNRRWRLMYHVYVI